MNVDVEIYVSQLVKFFKENPNDLMTLIPEKSKDLFFEMCRKQCIKNHESGQEIALTRKQMIDICVKINQDLELKKKMENIEVEGYFFQTPYGLVSLN